MKLAIASDHAGVEYKAALVSMLTDMGMEITDFGPATEDSVDYPDYGHKVAVSVKENQVDLGILLCGSGNGINMTANKHQEIRSALCWKEEIAVLARQHNNANILALPARFISLDEAKTIVKSFITTSFEGGRHERRVNKIACS